MELHTERNIYRQRNLPDNVSLLGSNWSYLESYMDNWDLAQSLHLHLVVVSWENSHMGQLNQTKISWSFLLPQLSEQWRNHSTPHGFLPHGQPALETLTFRWKRPCRLLGDIRSTISNWNPEPYNNKILNKLWTILRGLLLWTIWKETNKWVFKIKKTSIEIIWNNLRQNIKETLALNQWMTEDFPTATRTKHMG